MFEYFLSDYISIHNSLHSKLPQERLSDKQIAMIEKMKKGIVLACCVMLLAGQLQSAEALDWNRRIGVFLLPCVPLRYALPCSANEQERQRKEKQRVSYLHPEASCDYQHGVQDLISSAPRPCYAGTDKSLGRTVENRISQTCACCKFGQKRLFSSTVHGAFSFPQEEKRMGGVFQ